VLGARVFMACGVLFAVILTVSGVPWYLALLFTGLSYGMYLAVGRVVAESGFAYVQPYWAPASLLVGILGYAGMGWQTALVLMVFSATLMVDTREPLIAFFMSGFKILEGQGLSAGRGARYGVVALVAGLAVAVPVTIYIKYDFGSTTSYSWAARSVPQAPYRAALVMKHSLESQGVLDDAGQPSATPRLTAIRPDAPTVTGFAVMFGLFLALSALRIRFHWWPLHPILLLVSGQGMAFQFVGSFLIGCALKHALVMYGGQKVVRAVLPAVIGVIAGDLLFGLAGGIIGAAYYFVTGATPPRFTVLI
jgi:hypothetical protein